MPGAALPDLTVITAFPIEFRATVRSRTGLRQRLEPFHDFVPLLANRLKAEPQRPGNGAVEIAAVNRGLAQSRKGNDDEAAAATPFEAIAEEVFQHYLNARNSADPDSRPRLSSVPAAQPGKPPATLTSPLCIPHLPPARPV